MLTTLLLPQDEFLYGYEGKAKYQLKSLAAKSHVAFQTLTYNCKNSGTVLRVVGWNGVEFPLTESSSSVMEDIDVENDCKVSECMSSAYLECTHSTHVSECIPLQVVLFRMDIQYTLSFPRDCPIVHI